MVTKILTPAENEAEEAVLEAARKLALDYHLTEVSNCGSNVVILPTAVKNDIKELEKALRRLEQVKGMR